MPSLIALLGIVSDDNYGRIKILTYSGGYDINIVMEYEYNVKASMFSVIMG